MKSLQHLSILVFLFLLTTTSFAQTPNAINYQAVARDGNGDIMANQSIDVTFGFYDASTGGTLHYKEDHTGVMTNQFGLFSLKMGLGNPVSGTFSAIDWSGSSIWLEVQIDGSIVGSRAQLLAVPYALIAQSAENDLVDDADADPTNELQTLSINANNLEISNGNSVVLPFGTATSQIQDVDGDTKVQTEESADEDIIRFDLVGIEQWIMTGVRLEPVNSGNSIFIGESAGANDDLSANYNTGIGYEALQLNTNGFYNTGVGARVLTSNTVGTFNTAIGYRALANNTSGNQNTGDGFETLYFNTTGSQNTAIGWRALNENTTGSQNTAGGIRSLTMNTTGSFNTASGYEALHSNATGNSNVGIGSGALHSVSNRSNLVAVGDSALYTEIAGDRSTAIGSKALFSSYNAVGNTAVGFETLYSNTNGGGNTAIGDRALHFNLNGYNNVAAGFRTLFNNTTGWDNTAVGRDALFSNQNSADNTAVGHEALYSTTSGGNTAIGSGTLYYNTSGTFNSAVGLNALRSNTTGDGNVSSGYQALFFNTTGTVNSAYGNNALFQNSTGGYNTAVGFRSLQDNTTAYYNTAIGADALSNNTIGQNNTAVGYLALAGNTSGHYNTAIGISAFHGGGVDSFSNSTAVGHNADITASDQVRIGNASVTSIGGSVNWTTISDGNFKQQVIEDVVGLEFISKLRPVTYHMDIDAIDAFYSDHYGDDGLPPYDGRYTKETYRYSGFIAQEVETAANSVGYDFSGVDAPKNPDDFYGLRYAEFVVPLVKAVQEQQELIIELQDQNVQQKAQIDQLIKLLDQ